MTWSEMTPAERADLCKDIARILHNEGQRPQSSMMIHMALDYATVGFALAALVESGAVVANPGVNGAPVIFAAVKRTD